MSFPFSRRGKPEFSLHYGCRSEKRPPTEAAGAIVLRKRRALVQRRRCRPFFASSLSRFGLGSGSSRIAFMRSRQIGVVPPNPHRPAMTSPPTPRWRPNRPQRRRGHSSDVVLHLTNMAICIVPVDVTRSTRIVANPVGEPPIVAPRYVGGRNRSISNGMRSPRWTPGRVDGYWVSAKLLGISGNVIRVEL